LAAFTVGLLFTVSGCGGGDAGFQSAADEGLPEEGIAVRKAFESASPSLKNPVQESLRRVKAGSTNPDAYIEALPQLQRLAANPNISPDQKQALDALIQKLRTELSAGNRQ